MTLFRLLSTDSADVPLHLGSTGGTVLVFFFCSMRWHIMVLEAKYKNHLFIFLSKYQRPRLFLRCQSAGHADGIIVSGTCTGRIDVHDVVADQWCAVSFATAYQA